MKQKYDAIVVGAGHNGLTAAGYLGKAGFKTIVLERLPVVGGAVVTEEIYPGYRISAVSYVVSLLRSEIIRDLELKKHVRISLFLGKFRQSATTGFGHPLLPFSHRLNRRRKRRLAMC
jgi:phytoene dehydrogenase-like protein